jgi:hypothetical protein
MNDTVNPASPRPKWTQVKLKRVVLGLVIIFTCLGALQGVIWFLEPWYFAREISHADAHLDLTPVRLHDTSLSPLAPGRLGFFDFSFQVPWKQVETQKVTKTSAVVLFREGAALIVFDPSETTKLSSAMHQQSKPLASIFGSRAMSSGYDWMASELTAAPDQIRWWNRTNNVRLALLLGMKSIKISNECTVIYRVENPELHGFEFCDPAAAPYRITLNVFDVNNRSYEMVIASRRADQPVVTQADINAIIASMRPIPHN